MRKKIISIMLCATMMMALGSTAVAQQDISRQALSHLGIAEDDIARLRNIPFFVAEVEESDEATWNSVSSIIDDVYISQTEKSSPLGTQDISSESCQMLNQAGIRQIDSNEVFDLAHDPIYAHTISRLRQLVIEDGLTVKYVTFYAPVSSVRNNTPAKSAPFGTSLLAYYNGYEFRWHDVGFTIQTNWFTHTNYSMNWRQFISASAALSLTLSTDPFQQFLLR